jgi:hypothetical protein
MSRDAARAAEVLAQLSSPPRLLAFAEMVRRGDRAGTTYGLGRPLPDRSASIID